MVELELNTLELNTTAEELKVMKNTTSAE